MNKMNGMNDVNKMNEMNKVNDVGLDLCIYCGKSEVRCAKCVLLFCSKCDRAEHKIACAWLEDLSKLKRAFGLVLERNVLTTDARRAKIRGQHLSVIFDIGSDEVWIKFVNDRDLPTAPVAGRIMAMFSARYRSEIRLICYDYVTI